MSQVRHKFYLTWQGLWFFLALGAILGCGKVRLAKQSAPVVEEEENHGRVTRVGAFPVGSMPKLPTDYAPFIAMGAAAHGGHTPTAMCTQRNDKLATAAEVDGRIKWSKKCFTQGAKLIRIGESFTDISGNPLHLAPHFGRVDENNHDFNPQNWFAPKDESAACDGPPEAYQIVGLCAVGA